MFRIAWILLALFDLAFLTYSLTQLHKKTILPPTPDWSFTMTLKDDELWRQYEASEAIGSLPAGYLRIAPEANSPFPLPTLEHQLNPNKVSILDIKDFLKRSADLNSSELIFITYSNFEQNYGSFPHPIPIREDHQSIAILLDASGTMGEKNLHQKHRNEYEIALLNLNQMRKGSDQSWLFFSFSNQLKSHGPWEKDMGPPKLESTGGRTKLLAALNQFMNEGHQPAHLIVVTDGAITESLEDEVKSTFKRIQGQGTTLHLLSPTLKELPRFNKIYGLGLASFRWPQKNSPKTLQITEAQIQENIKVKWNNLTQTRSTQPLQALFFSKEGWPVVYHHENEGKQYFHIIGEPDEGIENLSQMILESWKHTPIITINSSGVIVDFIRPLKGNLLLATGPYQPKVLQPGRYFIPLQQPWPVELKFFHPEAGHLQIKALETLGPSQLQIEPETKSQIKFWVRDMNPSIKWASLILALAHFVLLAVLILRISKWQKL